MRRVSPIWKILGIVVLFFVLVVLPVTLWIFIGSFRAEWTCSEPSSDWACVGGPNCVREAGKHVLESKTRADCKRTDWIGTKLEKIGSFFEQPPP